MPYRMGTDSRESDDRDIYGVRLGVERVELVLPLWSCDVHHNAEPE